MMETKTSKRFIAVLILLSMLMSICLGMSAMAAAGVSSTFWKTSKNFNEDNLIVIAATEKQFDNLVSKSNSSSAFSSALNNLVVANKVSGSGTTMIIRPSKKTNSYYTAFLTSANLSNVFRKAGGQTIRVEVDGLAVERSASKVPNAMNFTDMRQSDSELRGAVSGAWSIRSSSANSNGDLEIEHPFVLRFELDGSYKASELQLMTAGEDGEVTPVDTDLKISKSGNTYYARTGLLYDGIYSIVKKSK